MDNLHSYFFQTPVNQKFKQILICYSMLQKYL